MKERPILFSAAMVRALLDGTKTQTRRIVKPQPIFQPGQSFGDAWKWSKGADEFSCVTTEQLVGDAGLLYADRCPYRVGDRLWVKESAYIAPKNWADYPTDCNRKDADGDPRIVGYAASMDGDSVRAAKDYKLKLSPSIFMPRWASRLTLGIVSVRVERLQDIGPSDIRAEGIIPPESEYADPAGGINIKRWISSHLTRWETLWNSINAVRGFTIQSNPFVWVVEFRRVEQTFTLPPAIADAQRRAQLTGEPAFAS